MPADRKTNPWWGQEYGLFKMPMAALHYALTKDHASFEKSVAYLKWLAGTADWTDGRRTGRGRHAGSAMRR